MTRHVQSVNSIYRAIGKRTINIIILTINNIILTVFNRLWPGREAGQHQLHDQENQGSHPRCPRGPLLQVFSTSSCFACNMISKWGQRAILSLLMILNRKLHMMMRRHQAYFRLKVGLRSTFSTPTAQCLIGFPVTTMWKSFWKFSRRKITTLSASPTCSHTGKTNHPFPYHHMFT